MLLQLIVFQVVSSLYQVHGFSNSSSNSKKTRSLYGKYDYQNFQPFSKMEKELKRLSRDRNKQVKVTLTSIGKTFEERDLWAIKFQLKDSRHRKSIVVDCGAHAREWLAPATCMYLISQFSLDSSNKAQVSLFYSALKQYDWVIIPTLNPDGYAYTWHNKSTRLWRKNRSFTKKQLKIIKKKKKEICRGVDINRNFDIAWGGPSAPVKDPCYEMYAGDEPFSEKESKALAKYLKSIKNNIKAYISLHCFGLKWMTPWGYKKTHPKDYKTMTKVAKTAVDAMKQFSGVQYSVGTSYKDLYPNSGNSVDWVYKNLKIPYSYLIEMFPNFETKIDSDGFKQSAQDMIKNAQEITVGLTTMAETLKMNDGINKHIIL